MTSKENVEQIVLKHALKNAIEHGSARPGAVIGHVLAEKPELKKQIDSLKKTVSKTIQEVNKMQETDRVLKIKKVWPTAFQKKEKKTQPRLKPLEDTEKGVVMRFAPNPNGPPSIATARGIVINSEYAKKYGGKLVLRFDDTDPKTKKPLPSAYEWYVEDCEWLGAKPDKVVAVSDNMPSY
jgi:glutamyl-tRNA synthetase